MEILATSKAMTRNLPVIVVLRLVGETIVKEHVLINVLLPNVEDHSETVHLDALRDSTEQIATRCTVSE
jgi:hypothetical protein